MTARARFKAIVHFDRPDYVPIFAFPGAPGMSNGCMEPTRKRLVEQGMPDWVGVEHVPYQGHPLWSWQRYWGTTSPVYPAISTFIHGPGIRSDRRNVEQVANLPDIEGKFEIIEYETSARTRQVINNDETYIMPDFQKFHVRDRKSWEFYRERTEPRGMRPIKEIDAEIARFDEHGRPVAIDCGSTWGYLRGLMEPAGASFVLYDDPHYGRQPWLLKELEDDKEIYIADVPCDTRVWLERPKVGIPHRKGDRGRKPTKVRVLDGSPSPIKVEDLFDKLPESKWETIYVRDTERGELWTRITYLRVYPVRDELPGPETWLILREDKDVLSLNILEFA